MITVTGAVVYTSTLTPTTKASFTNLKSAGSLTVTQSGGGNISLPNFTTSNGALALVGGATTLTVSLPKLTKATSLSFTGMSKTTTFSMPEMVAHDGDIDITIADSGAIDISKFTNATTQVGAADANPDKLTVNAATLTAPVYKAGQIVSTEVASISLPVWEGTANSTFTDALTVVLPKMSATKTADVSLVLLTMFPDAESIHIVGNTAASATTTYEVSVDASNHTDLETLILGGTFGTVDMDGNSDLVTLTFDATAEDFILNASDVVTADVKLTAAAASATGKTSVSVTNNTKLESITFTGTDNLNELTITGNADLETASFPALDSTSGTYPNATITGNDFAATLTYTNAAATAGGTVSTSGIVAMKDFLDDVIAKRKGSVAMKVNIENMTVVSSTGTVTDPALYKVVDLIAGTIVGANDAVAYQRAFDLKTTGSGNVQIMVGSDALFVNASNAATAITPSANMALAISELKTAASRATALGLSMDVVSGGNVQDVNIVFATTLDSATNENSYGPNSATTLLGTDDYATLTIGSQSVTSTYVTGYSGTATATAGIASGLAAAWAAKYTTASSLYAVDGDTTSGTIVVSVDNGSGNRADGDLVSVSFGSGADTSTTPLLAWKIGATNASTDNKLLGDRVIVLLANATAGVTGVTSPTVTYNGTLTASGTLTSADDFSAAKAIGYLGNVWRTEARGLAINGRDSAAGSAGVTAITVDNTKFL
jgi:hypothetical protein